MRIALIAALILITIAILITAIGLLMSRTHSTTSEITVKQPIDSVYALARDIGGMTTWWRELKVSKRVAGAPGERWMQEAGGFKMQLDITNESAPHHFTTKIVEEKGTPFGGEWVYRFTPSGSGTTVSITENGWIGPPPFRVISKLRGLNTTMDAILVSLARHYGEDVKPVHK